MNLSSLDDTLPRPFHAFVRPPLGNDGTDHVCLLQDFSRGIGLAALQGNLVGVGTLTILCTTMAPFPDCGSVTSMLFISTLA